MPQLSGSTLLLLIITFILGIAATVDLSKGILTEAEYQTYISNSCPSKPLSSDNWYAEETNLINIILAGDNFQLPLFYQQDNSTNNTIIQRDDIIDTTIPSTNNTSITNDTSTNSTIIYDLDDLIIVINGTFILNITTDNNDTIGSNSTLGIPIITNSTLQTNGSNTNTSTVYDPSKESTNMTTIGNTNATANSTTSNSTTPTNNTIINDSGGETNSTFGNGTFVIGRNESTKVDDNLPNLSNTTLNTTISINTSVIETNSTSGNGTFIIGRNESTKVDDNLPNLSNTTLDSNTTRRENTSVSEGVIDPDNRKNSTDKFGNDSITNPTDSSNKTYPGPEVKYGGSNNTTTNSTSGSNVSNNTNDIIGTPEYNSTGGSNSTIVGSGDSSINGTKSINEGTNTTVGENTTPTTERNSNPRTGDQIALDIIRHEIEMLIHDIVGSPDTNKPIPDLKIRLETLDRDITGVKPIHHEPPVNTRPIITTSEVSPVVETKPIHKEPAENTIPINTTSPTNPSKLKDYGIPSNRTTTVDPNVVSNSTTESTNSSSINTSIRCKEQCPARYEQRVCLARRKGSSHGSIGTENVVVMDGVIQTTNNGPPEGLIIGLSVAGGVLGILCCTGTSILACVLYAKRKRNNFWSLYEDKNVKMLMEGHIDNSAYADVELEDDDDFDPLESNSSSNESNEDDFNFDEESEESEEIEFEY